MSFCGFHIGGSFFFNLMRPKTVWLFELLDATKDVRHKKKGCSWQDGINTTSQMWRFFLSGTNTPLSHVYIGKQLQHIHSAQVRLEIKMAPPIYQESHRKTLWMILPFLQNGIPSTKKGTMQSRIGVMSGIIKSKRSGDEGDDGLYTRGLKTCGTWNSG